MIMTADEEARLKALKGRLRANVDFDYDALKILGIDGDIYGMLDNLGWRQFSNGIDVGVQEEIAMEMLITMHLFMRWREGVEVPCLDFCLKDEDKTITIDDI